MVLVAAIGNTSQVCDHSLVSYAFEQLEMIRSHDYKHRSHAQFHCVPTVSLVKPPVPHFSMIPKKSFSPYLFLGHFS